MHIADNGAADLPGRSFITRQGRCWAALHHHSNFPAFRPGQEVAIQHVLNGRLRV